MLKGNKPIKTSLFNKLNKLISKGQDKVVTYLHRSVYEEEQSRPKQQQYYQDDSEGPKRFEMHLKNYLDGVTTENKNNQKYCSEEFSEADVNYIEEESAKSTVEKFSIFDEVDTEELSVSALPVATKNKTLTLDRTKRSPDSDGNKNVEAPKIIILTRPRKKSPADPVDDLERASGLSSSSVSELDNPSRALVATIDDEKTVSIQPDLPVNASKKSNPPSTSNSDVDSYGLKVNETLVDDAELDAVDTSDIVDFYDDPLEDIDYTDSIDNNSLHDTLEVDDFDWDDLEELEEFDAFARRETEEKELVSQRLTRKQRAKQIAVELLDSVGWDFEHLPLVEMIFIENGWGPARAAIEGQIELGITPEELSLARQIRIIWFENEYYWTSFRMRSNALSMQAESVYKNFSWVDAIRVVNCFSSTSDIDEVQVFLDDLFDEWYFNNHLRRVLKAFYKYVKYRLGVNRRTLSGDMEASFSYPLDVNWGADNEEFLNPSSEVREHLLALGLESGFSIQADVRAPSIRRKSD